MSTSDTLEIARDRSPEEIEVEIAATRESLDRKLHELEKRLDPRYQWAELRGNVQERLASTPMAAWGALAAVAVGIWMALAGLRRRRLLDTTLVATDAAICDEL
jgi:hypothetical protein